MRICQKHWNELKRLINIAGLSSYITKDSKQAMNNVLKELNNEAIIPDPLMICNNMLISRSIDAFGLDVMKSDKCPCCYANENYQDKEDEPTGDFWIRTLVPHIKKMFKEKGLLNNN